VPPARGTGVAEANISRKQSGGRGQVTDLSLLSVVGAVRKTTLRRRRRRW
jgi:hypothetical protein